MTDPRFQTEDSGGGFDTPYEATTVDAFFQEGDFGVRLHFRNRLDHPELMPNVEGGEITEQLSLPRGWVTVGGIEATHPDGPTKKYSSSSQVGILISGNNGKASYQGAPYHGLSGILTDIPPEWSAYTATSYKGLHALWAPVEWQTRRPKREQTGVDLEGKPVMEDVIGADGKAVWEEVTVSRRMPVALLGGAQGAGNGAVPSSVDLAALSLPDDLLGALRAAAPAWTGYDNMVASLMAVDGALAHQPLAALVSDKGSWPALKDALTG